MTSYVTQLINEWHNKAMGLCDLAEVYYRRYRLEEGYDIGHISRLYAQALDYERRAANLLAPGEEREPGRAILYRSAGWIAVRCYKYGEAIACAEEGLKGKPPAWAKAELNEVIAWALPRQRRAKFIQGVVNASRQETGRAWAIPAVLIYTAQRPKSARRGQPKRKQANQGSIPAKRNSAAKSATAKPG